ALAGTDDQQTCRIPGRGGFKRDALFGQLEVEEVDAHYLRIKRAGVPATVRGPRALGKRRGTGPRPEALGGTGVLGGRCGAVQKASRALRAGQALARASHSGCRFAPARAASFFVGEHVDLKHPVGLTRRLAARDGIDVLHAFDDLTPDRVLPGQVPAAVAETDEKLAIGRVGVAGARRGHAAAPTPLFGAFGGETGRVR